MHSFLPFLIAKVSTCNKQVRPTLVFLFSPRLSASSRLPKLQISSLLWFSKAYPKTKGFFPSYICTHIHTYISGLSDTFYLKLFIGLCFSTQGSLKQWTMNDPNQTPLEQFCILHAKKCSHNKVTKWMSLCLNRGIKLNCDKRKLFKGSLVHVYQITLNIMCWTKALILLVLSNRNILRNKPIFLL